MMSNKQADRKTPPAKQLTKLNTALWVAGNKEKSQSKSRYID